MTGSDFKTKAAAAVGACCLFTANHLTLHRLLEIAPSIVGALPFLQTLSIVLCAAVTCRVDTKRVRDHWKWYACLALITCGAQDLNTRPLQLGVSLSLAVAIRCSIPVITALGTMIATRTLLSARTLLNTLLISGSIGCLVYLQGAQAEVTADGSGERRWASGIGLLLMAACLGSLLGLVQSDMYKRKMCTSNEMALVTNAIALVPLALRHLGTEKLQLSTEDAAAGRELRLLLFVNIATHTIGVFTVYYLAKQAGALACSLTLAVRKFLSICLGQLLFPDKVEWRWQQWALVLCMFLSLVSYTLDSGQRKSKSE